MENDLKKADTWIRKNWFTMLGIIIILGVVWIDLLTVGEQKQTLVDECNEYWKEQVKTICPALAGDSNQTIYNALYVDNISLEMG